MKKRFFKYERNVMFPLKFEYMRKNARMSKLPVRTIANFTSIEYKQFPRAVCFGESSKTNLTKIVEFTSRFFVHRAFR